jgi:hypothetical protein
MLEKTINLISLVNAYHDLSTEVLDVYLNTMGVKVKQSEMEDITKLVDKIKSTKINKTVFDNYYVGFTINQIGKEFDLLRLGLNYNINIELKKKSTQNKVQKQLIKNRYYLSFLEKEVLNFTYVVDEDILYFLEKDNSISEVDIDFLVCKLFEQEVLEVEDINKLFDPSNYLVSPFNSTERFIANEYFLTNHQESIKEKFYAINSTSQKKLFSIEGSAGTGKTLLVYDLAKEFINAGKKVLIIHCGILNNGHSKLIHNYSWNIISIKDYKKTFEEHYDLIIIDEAQRIYKNQFEEIVNYAVTNQSTCIFSYDPNQCLHNTEIQNNIPKHIDSIVKEKFKLTEKIRTNTEIAAFIKNLFDLSKRNPQQNYSNIEIQYFSDISNARSYIESLKLKGWIAIDYTVSRYTWCSLDKILIQSNENAHTVIGQEFDKVVAVIGESYYYDSNGKLMGDTESYYHPTKMLFQILTRARKKLCLVIVNNETLLKKCLEIIN